MLLYESVILVSTDLALSNSTVNSFVEPSGMTASLLIDKVGLSFGLSVMITSTLSAEVSIFTPEPAEIPIVRSSLSSSSILSLIACTVNVAV